MKILFKSSNGARLTLIGNIVCLKADTNYTKISLYNPYKDEEKFDNFLALNSLASIEAKIKSNPNFFKCHRSCIINVNYFVEFNSTKLTIIMMNGMSVKLSRLKKIEFKEYLLSVVDINYTTPSKNDISKLI